MKLQDVETADTTRGAVAPGGGTRAADHLIQLPGEPWALWRSMVLRGAGLPAEQVLDLASAAGAAAADGLLLAEDEARWAQQAALEALAKEARQAPDEKRAELEKALKRLRKGKTPEGFEAEGEAGFAVELWLAAGRRLDAARLEFQETYEASGAEVSRAVRKVAGSKLFREAVTWQNREALHGSVDALLRTAPDATSGRSNQRRRERLITSYLQRYCTKNDTIGFFGPIGWAEFVAEGEAITARPGPGLLATRRVYFEGWCLDVLAAAMAKDKDLQPWIAPRRQPFVHLEGDMLRLPFEQPTKLPPAFAAVLAACDGERTAKEIALGLIGGPPGGVKSEAEVYRTLDTLQQRGVILWTLEVPWTLQLPRESSVEDNLRRLLERIGDEGLRRRMLGMLEELEGARDLVAAAAGDAEELDRALGRLDETFTRLTGADSKRMAGKTYAGRTLVFEDCRRDLDVEFGPAVLGAMAEPLPLLLASARWFTAEVAALYRDAFQKIYEELAASGGSRAVEAVNFWMRAQPLLFDDELRLVDTLVPEFQRRWAEVLSLPAGQRRVEYGCAQLRRRVLAAFDAPRPGWCYARYHSPDVMIVATSVEAIRRGEFQLVLGELHVGVNTTGSFYFLAQHPAPEESFRNLERDVPETRLVPVTPKDMATSRNFQVFLSPKDFRLEYTHDPSSVPRERALAIGALVVEEAEGGLVLRSRDGALRFDLMDAFADVLSGLATNSFKLLRAEKRTPRVTFDRMVICRETWRFAPDEMGFAAEKEESSRFLAARRWARANDMPRFVYVKTPVEIKPFYMDFDSPMLVDMFAKMVRQTAEDKTAAALISVSEMIPRLDQTWLPDAEGQRYTSELRIVAVDQAR
ncbi:MAG: lantibiotic dehydratase family protein [Acidobacteria bacterium]|nr:lantibiotic dehydratase family protein [Acidobacteriota bacterium]